VQRGQIMPGPTSLPVQAWMGTSISNQDTGACSPVDIWISDAAWQPVAGAQVWVQGAYKVVEGYTDNSGHIVLYGAHEGDTLFAATDNASGNWTVHCAVGPAAAASEPMVLSPNDFQVAVTVVPLSATQVRVEVETTATLSGNPEVELWQVASEEPVPVPMSYDEASARYTGLATLDPAGGTQGNVRVQANSPGCRTVVSLTSFKVQPAMRDEAADVRSADNAARLLFQPQGLSSDAFVAIQPAATGAKQQGRLDLVGSAYEITLVGGELTAPATLMMHYDSLLQVSTRSRCRSSAGTLKANAGCHCRARWTTSCAG
jgi:hypothetical protein